MVLRNTDRNEMSATVKTSSQPQGVYIEVFIKSEI